MWTVGLYKREFLAGPMTLSYVLGEARELVEAAISLDIDATREEWSDVILCLLAWVSKFLPIGWMPFLPGFGLRAAKKFAARIEVWQEIFLHHGKVFRKEYQIQGGNYRKRVKVERVLAAGGFEGEIDWGWVESRVGGFEG